MWISDNTKKFIQEHIQLIEENKWEEFFKQLHLSVLNRAEARDVVSILYKTNISYPKETREAVMLEAFDELFQRLKSNKCDRFFLRNIEYARYRLNNNLGYNLRELETMLVNNSADLDITVKIYNSDPLDTQIIL